MPTERGAHIAVATVFLAVIAAPGLIQVVSEVRRGEPSSALELFQQPPTARNLHAYERTLERTSLVIRRLRPWGQFVQWSVLGSVGEKAVVGRDGWLFYRPSVRYVVERPTVVPYPEAADPLPAIRSFRDQLQARGIRLLVVPVPNKESVYPERLAGQADGVDIAPCARTRRLFVRLAECGIAYLDLFALFRHARSGESRSDPVPLYLAQDTHWSPAGARLAATAVARRVLEEGVVTRGVRAYAERSVNLRRYGDLVEMLQSPQIERALEPERLVCRQVVEAGSGAPYRDAPGSEVVVLGDSFLRVYERDEPGAAGFIAQVARELGRPLSAIVNDGGASTLVRRQLARRPALLSNAKLVIWEFAEREIGSSTEGWPIVSLDRRR